MMWDWMAMPKVVQGLVSLYVSSHFASPPATKGPVSIQMAASSRRRRK